VPARRFPPPWSVDELEACFVVIDSGRISISRMSRGGDQRRNYYYVGPNQELAQQSRTEARLVGDFRLLLRLR